MRLRELDKIARKRRLDQVLVADPANIRAFTGVVTDNGVLTDSILFTDFRYIPAAHRVAPDLKVRDIRRLEIGGRRIGFEATIPHERYLAFKKAAPRATFVDISSNLSQLRAVKTPEEIVRLRASEAMADRVWAKARRLIHPGMTERAIQATIRNVMNRCSEGEAFTTIVCAGRNAAECHHEPDDTIWQPNEPLLVDMGVKLNGICSDLTRNIVPRRPTARYREVYSIVLKANLAAIAAARSGMTGARLDRVAREVIRKAGYSKAFGHSLGHGVGYEVHEAPSASRRDKTVLKPGMCVTIEPGIYLEGELGVRIEDLILITETGCEVLSHSEK